MAVSRYRSLSSIWPPTRPRTYAVCLDNDWPSGDDAYIKHISVPDVTTV